MCFEGFWSNRGKKSYNFYCKKLLSDTFFRRRPLQIIINTNSVNIFFFPEEDNASVKILTLEVFDFPSLFWFVCLSQACCPDGLWVSLIISDVNDRMETKSYYYSKFDRPEISIKLFSNILNSIHTSQKLVIKTW